MHIMRIAAVAGAIIAGSLGLSTGASASPLAASAMPAVLAGPAEGKTLATPVYHRGYPHYRRSYRGHPRYRHYRPVRPGYGHYRPRPRIVCRTQWRTVRTAYGRLVRRPVEICRRRW